MIVFYMLAGITAIAFNIELLPAAIKSIFVHAFTGKAVFGGMVGAGIKEAMRFGLARGLLSNESGQGSSPIAAAAARTDHPATQALVSMTQTFIDTLVVCSMTGFVIIMSQSMNGVETGAKLTAISFDTLLNSGFGSIITALGLAIFAYSTVLGWSYYGEICIEYIYGLKAIPFYRLAFVIVIFVGAVIRLETVWLFADVMNALMALPNLLALVLLGNEVRKIHRDYFSSTPLKNKTYFIPTEPSGGRGV